MKLETKLKIVNRVEKILDGITETEFPNLDTFKIAKFWLRFTLKIVDFISAIMFFISFTIIAPVYLKLTWEQIVIILLIIISLNLIRINKKTKDEEELW